MFDHRVLCAYCQAEGKTSRVFPNGGYSTLANSQSYYDEQGRFHSHDPNQHTEGWGCSNGHQWQKKTQRGCDVEGCPLKGSTVVTRLDDLDPRQGIPDGNGGLWVKGGS